MQIKALWPILQCVCERMDQFIREEMASRGSLDTRELCAKYTTDTVASSIYGVESGAFTDPNSKIRALAKNVFTPSFRLNFILKMSPILPWLTEVFKVRMVAKKEADFMLQLLRETIKYRQENNISRQDYTDYLINLREKKGLDEMTLVGHVASFFFDGIESSSLIMTNLFYLLAKHKNVQDKLRQKILAIKGPNNFEYEAVTNLPYLEQVIYETLRLHPVLAAHARVCTADFDMEVNGHSVTIPKGMGVWIPVHELHHDQEHYEQPESFWPERFDEERGGFKTVRDKCVLLSFGDGPRTCIGQKFAMAQIKSCVAHLLTNFEISVDPKTPEKLTYSSEEMMLAYNEIVSLKFKPL